MDFFVWNGIPLKRGDILNIEFPDTGGQELRKVRPAILVGFINIPKVMNTLTVVPLTTVLERKKLPYTLEVPHDGKNQLGEVCVALVYAISTVGPERIKGRKGELDGDLLSKLNILMKEHHA